MNSIDLSWLLVLEAVLPFLALNIVLILVIAAGKKKFKLAAKKLIKAVKSNEQLEREKLITFQTEKLAIEPKTAKNNAKKIINERKFLIRNLVSGLIDKNVQAISLLDQDITNLTDKYHELKTGLAITDSEPMQEAASVESTEDAASTEDKSESLKKEIKNLKQEVHITLTTLNNIFKEFSSMFGEDDIPDEQMSVDQIITTMESFSGKSKSETKTDTAENTDTDGEEKDTIEPDPNPEVEIKTEPQTAESTAPTDTATEVDVKTETEAEAEIEVEDSTLKPDEPVVATKSEQKPEASIEPTKAEPNAEPESDKTENADDLDFSVDAAIDDIDSALDELELDSTDEEPDWGDAFAESGDTMEDDPDKT